MFLPLADTNPLEHIKRPYVTWAIALINLAVFVLYQHGAGGQIEQASAVSFGAIPAVITGDAVMPPGYEKLPPALTLVTYMFLHGNWLHLLGNTAFLLVFGDNVEDAMGHVRYFIFYLLCGIAAAGAYVLAGPATQAPLIGASGAGGGLVAAYVMLHPHVRTWALVFFAIPLRLPALVVIGIWAAFQVWQVATTPDEGTGWWAHIGGLAAGAVLVTVLRRPGVALFDRDPSGVPTPRVLPEASVDRVEGHS